MGRPRAGSLRFGISRAHGGVGLLSGARLFTAALSEQLRRPVKQVVVADYDQLLEGIAVGGLDLAWMPPLLHMKAKDALLAAVCEREGAVVYRAAILVRADSAYRTVRDLRGARAAWSDPDSASGCLFPRLHLGVGRESHALASESFVGSPGKAMQAVIDGHADLCSCFVRESAENDLELALAEVKKQFPLAAQLRVVTVTDLIPPDGIVLAPNLDGAVQARVRDVLLGLHHDVQGAAALRALLNADRLVPVTGPVARTIDRMTDRMSASGLTGASKWIAGGPVRAR